VKRYTVVNVAADAESKRTSEELKTVKEGRSGLFENASCLTFL